MTLEDCMFQTDSVESTIREALARVDTYSLEEFTEQLPPTKPGIYQINCAQLCGNGHSAMASGRLYVDDEAAYNKWLEGAGSKATSFE